MSISENSTTDRLRALFKRRAQRFRRSSIFVKVGLVGVASGVAAVAQFVQIPANGTLTIWQAIGIAASIVVATGGIFVVFTEQDATEELAEAQNAIDEFRSRISDLFEEMSDEQGASERAIHLYQSVFLMRGAIEVAAVTTSVSLEALIEGLLEATEWTLPLALGFEQANRWTVCIYRAEPSESRTILRCVAHRRAIRCPLSDARVWRDGVGVVGTAYANDREIIVPDLLTDGLGTIFSLSNGDTKSYDDDRYRSIMASPIKIEGLDRPWGVVVATNDVPSHFTPDGEPGFRPAEAVRGLSGMVALAVAVCYGKQSGVGKGA